MSLRNKTDRRRMRGRSHRTAPAVAIAVLASLASARDAQAAPDVAVRPYSYAEVVARTVPAVVTVETDAPGTVSRGWSDAEPSLEEFLRRLLGIPRGSVRPSIPVAPDGSETLGSGFLVSADGTVVTNSHVVAGATSIAVVLADGTRLEAELVGSDGKADLAVLKVHADRPLPTLDWGDSDRLRTGDPILAIGNSFGLGTNATSGIVSATGRDLQRGPYDDFLQVDAALNEGNSGGPVLDADGRVVGIGTAIVSPNGGSVGVGFAIPSNEARPIVGRLLARGTVEHGYLGVQVQELTAAMAEAVGLPRADGVLVAALDPDAPAAAAGVRAGDVLLTLSGRPVASSRDLLRRVADLEPGTRVELGIWRDGAPIALAVELGSAEGAEAGVPQVPDASPSAVLPELGLELAELSARERAERSGIPEDAGVIVVEALPGSGAEAAGIAAGDVLLSVNQRRTASVSDVRSAVADAARQGRSSILAQVSRDGGTAFVVLPILGA